MADISYKNKKFPLKAVPTISLAFIVAAISSISVMYFLDDDENFLDLNEFEVQEIEYEFQTILEEDSFNNLDIIEVVLEEECKYFAQSGSFRSYEAAMSQVEQLQNIDYTAEVENVSSANGFNYKVIVGPFENRSQTNNAREVLRRFNMDSLEIRSCIKINNES